MVGLVVVAALAVAVGVTVRRRRRLRAGGAGLDPLFAVTGLGAAGGPLVFFLAGFGLLGLSAGWGWFLYAYWPARHHDQTAGMRAVGLRVVTLDGSPVGLGRHIVRWLLFAVETNLGGLIVLLAVTCSARHQRLGDVAAGTVVVRHDLRPVSARQPSPHQASRW